MAKVKALIHAFNAGEASDAAMARIDQETIRLTAERQENLLPYVVGKAIQRPGLGLLAAADYTSGLAHTLNESQGVTASMIIPFKRSASETALLEFAASGFTISSRFYKNVMNADIMMRVYVDDALIDYPPVDCTYSLYDSAAYPAVADVLQLQAVSRGDNNVWNNSGNPITTGSPGVMHCLFIQVGLAPGESVFGHDICNAGSVNLKIGTTIDGSGVADDLFATASLPWGIHFIAFTPPSTTFYIQLDTTEMIAVPISGIKIYNNVTGSYAIEYDSPLDNIPLTVPFAFLRNFTDTNFPYDMADIDLRSLQYTQSLDEVFCSLDEQFPQFIVQHRDSHSWSIVNYVTRDGPFQTAQSDANVYLKLAGTEESGAATEIGQTQTITASKPLWGATGDVNANDYFGQLVQITHDNMDSTFFIGGVDNVATPAFRVVGVQASGDRSWVAHIAGTWVGIIRVERSFDNQFSGFEHYATVADITVNGDVSVNDADDNEIIWYRFVFDTWTSGFANIDIVYGGYGFTGVGMIVDASGFNANIIILSPFANIKPSNNWLMGDWSRPRGYPTGVSLFDGRLWWGREDAFWGSVSENYFSFATALANTTSSTTITGDSSSIQRKIATGGSYDDIAYILPLQRLIFGTSGAEVSARSSALDQPLTPTDITLKDCSSQGSARTMPVKIDHVGIFVQRSTRKLYALEYDPYGQDYQAINLMRINEEIGFSPDPSITDGFVQIAVQRQPETYIWGVRADGFCVNMLYETQDKVKAWFKMFTGQYDGDDSINCVAVLPTRNEDAVYFLTERANANDGTSVFVEKMQSHYNTIRRNFVDKVLTTATGAYQVDSYKTFTATTNALLVCTGLDHLEGRIVMALGYSVPRDEYGPIINAADDTKFFTVSNGTISLGELADGLVVVGLPYEGFYKTSKLAYGAGQGSTALLTPKSVHGAGLLLSDTHPDALLIGSDFDGIESMDPLPRLEDLLPVVKSGFKKRVYDARTFPIANVDDTDARICIKVMPGYSATLSALVIAIETSDG